MTRAQASAHLEACFGNLTKAQFRKLHHAVIDLKMGVLCGDDSNRYVAAGKG